MRPIKTLADIDPLQEGGELGELGRKVLMLCRVKGSPGYWNMAQILNVTYHDMACVGADLRARGLARVSYTRSGGRFSGSVIHLTGLGEQLKEYVASRDWD